VSRSPVTASCLGGLPSLTHSLRVLKIRGGQVGGEAVSTDKGQGGKLSRGDRQATYVVGRGAREAGYRCVWGRTG